MAEAYWRRSQIETQSPNPPKDVPEAFQLYKLQPRA